MTSIRLAKKNGSLDTNPFAGKNTLNSHNVEVEIRAEIIPLLSETANDEGNPYSDVDLITKHRAFVENMDKPAYYINGDAITHVHYVRAHIGNLVIEEDKWLPTKWLKPVTTLQLNN